ncbi:MAG: sugar ABC transporter permease [Spirochaetales bacterium]|nr:sugar ABC transporter permease [Spirochaetales bacterium]
MVSTQAKRWGTFAAFVSPALILYVMFAIVPMLMGLWLSTTNWDGVGPWVPVQIPIDRFENEVLANLNPSQQAFLNTYYIKDEGQGTYRKQETDEKSLRGYKKYRAMALFSKAGYTNPNFRFVGLANYMKLFSSDSEPDFWPQKLQVVRFKPGDPLTKALSIPKKEFEENFLPNITSSYDSNLIKSLYRINGENYLLDETHFPRKGRKFSVAKELLAQEDIGDEWEGFLDAVEAAAKNSQTLDVQAIMTSTITAAANGSLSPESQTLLENGAVEVYDAARLKSILSSNWFDYSNRMGVLLFTAFFSISNVIAVNVLALLIALALDRKLKTQNVLRSVFFIPNVLSMIVVAFIWQLVFSHVFPLITGTSRWLSNPDVAPALTVTVATWQAMGYYMIIYLAGLQNVPQDILESAAIDGAGGIKRFTGIILPMLVPAITIALFLSISGSLKTFDIIFALYPSTTSTMGVENLTINIYRDAFVDRQAGLATAKAILLMLVIGTITGLQVRATKKREVEL